MLKDYSMAFDGCAIFLPAISKNYAEYAVTDAFERDVGFLPADFDFLKPGGNLFYYPFALYSAGQTKGSVSKDNMVQSRDRSSTFALADSGGYQVATGTAGVWKGERTALRHLRWMEKHGDYCMVLDFPTGGIGRGSIAPHRERLIAEGVDLNAMNKINGLGLDFNACLYQTSTNNHLYLMEAKSDTKFLNVVQGRNYGECDAWLNEVGRYPFSGWAFAGVLKDDLSLFLKVIIKMRDDGLLNGCELVHFLGDGKLHKGCLYTTIKDCLRDTFGREIIVSYDASSSFTMAANYNIYTSFTLDRSGWSIQGAGKNDLLSIARSDDTFQNVCAVAGREKLERKFDEYGTTVNEGFNVFVAESAVSHSVSFNGSERSFLNNDIADTASVMMAYNHNLHVLIDAHRRAQIAFRQRLHEQVPLSLLTASMIIEKVFKSETPYSLIEECESHLDFT